jgi:hypothetical protein
MAEMMVDGVEGVEADMSFRDVETLEIRRREMVDDTMTFNGRFSRVPFTSLKNNISQVIIRNFRIRIRACC